MPSVLDQPINLGLVGPLFYVGRPTYSVRSCTDQPTTRNVGRTHRYSELVGQKQAARDHSLHDHVLGGPTLHSAAGSPQEGIGTHPNKQPTGCPPPQLSGRRVQVGGGVTSHPTRPTAYRATLQIPPRGSKVSSGGPDDLLWHPDTSQPDGLFHALWNNIGQDEGR